MATAAWLIIHFQCSNSMNFLVASRHRQIHFTTSSMRFLYNASYTLLTILHEIEAVYCVDGDVSVISISIKPGQVEWLTWTWPTFLISHSASMFEPKISKKYDKECLHEVKAWNKNSRTFKYSKENKNKSNGLVYICFPNIFKWCYNTINSVPPLAM